MSFLPQKVKRVVFKLGTGVLTRSVGELDNARIRGIGREIAALRQRGIEVVIVSSGAVGLGMGRLGLKKRPTRLSSVQKCAAVGQSILIETWQKALSPHGLNVAQLLLTREDVRGRNRHVAIKNLLDEIITDGIIPVINENDSVSSLEIKFGDNDVLSALTAILTRADLLVILSTAPGLIDMKGSGQIVPVVEKITPQIEAMACGTTTITAVGGMITKIHAAKIATAAGCGVFIASGEDPARVADLFAGKAIGTFFVPSKIPMHSRKRWIAYFNAPQGGVCVDEGAQKALLKGAASLLAKGLTCTQGHFEKGDVISICDKKSTPFARGIAGFSSEQTSTLIGKSSAEVKKLFPKSTQTEIIHRDTLVLL